MTLAELLTRCARAAHDQATQSPVGAELDLALLFRTGVIAGPYRRDVTTTNEPETVTMSTPFDRRIDARAKAMLAGVPAKQGEFEVEMRRADGSFARFVRVGGDACGHVVDLIDGSGARVSVRPVRESARAA